MKKTSRPQQPTTPRLRLERITTRLLTGENLVTAGGASGGGCHETQGDTQCTPLHR
jgi:hypothetical protein